MAAGRRRVVTIPRVRSGPTFGAHFRSDCPPGPVQLVYSPGNWTSAPLWRILGLSRGGTSVDELQAPLLHLSLWRGSETKLDPNEYAATRVGNDPLQARMSLDHSGVLGERVGRSEQEPAIGLHETGVETAAPSTDHTSSDRIRRTSCCMVGR